MIKLLYKRTVFIFKLILDIVLYAVKVCCMKRNTDRKIKKVSKKLRVKANISEIHLGSKLMSGNPREGIINLETQNRLHLLDKILLRHLTTV